jgi:hypothetical protein
VAAVEVVRVVVAPDVLLHLSEFLFFLALLEVQDLHLSLKAAFLFTETLVF